MTAQERNGRRTILAMAWLTAAPPIVILCVMALSGREVSMAVWIFKGVVPVALSSLLLQGRRWIRGLTIIVFSINVAGALSQLVLTDGTLTMMLVLCTEAVTQGITVAVLIGSPAVKEFFAYKNRLLMLDVRGA